MRSLMVLLRRFVVYPLLMALGLTLLVGVIGWLWDWQSLANYALALRFGAVIFCVLSGSF